MASIVIGKNPGNVYGIEKIEAKKVVVKRRVVISLMNVSAGHLENMRPMYFFSPMQKYHLLRREQRLRSTLRMRRNRNNFVRIRHDKLAWPPARPRIFTFL